MRNHLSQTSLSHTHRCSIFVRRTRFTECSLVQLRTISWVVNKLGEDELSRQWQTQTETLSLFSHRFLPTLTHPSSSWNLNIGGDHLAAETMFFRKTYLPLLLMNYIFFRKWVHKFFCYYLQTEENCLAIKFCRTDVWIFLCGWEKSFAVYLFARVYTCICILVLLSLFLCDVLCALAFFFFFFFGSLMDAPGRCHVLRTCDKWKQREREGGWVRRRSGVYGNMNHIMYTSTQGWGRVDRTLAFISLTCPQDWFQRATTVFRFGKYFAPISSKDLKRHLAQDILHNMFLPAVCTHLYTHIRAQYTHLYTHIRVGNSHGHFFSPFFLFFFFLSVVDLSWFYYLKLVDLHL